jgi:Fur family transcriptional regulator, ferric uptake regulator
MITKTEDKDALHKLQKAGLSRTPQRIAVLNTLIRAAAPINISGIRQALETKTCVNRVTVYRILSLLKQHGIIREISSKGGVNYFELATVENPVHPHFICRICAIVYCLEPLTFSQAKQWISTEKDYSIEHIEINISGICSGCRNAIQLQKQPYKKGK